MMLRVILTRFHLSSFPLLKGFNLILQMKCIALVTSFNCMSLVHFLHLSPSCTLGSFATSYAGRHWCLVTWEAVTTQQSHITLQDLQECVMVALTGKRDLEMAASCMKWTCGCGNSGEGIRDPEESMSGANTISLCFCITSQAAWIEKKDQRPGINIVFWEKYGSELLIHTGSHWFIYIHNSSYCFILVQNNISFHIGSQELTSNHIKSCWIWLVHVDSYQIMFLKFMIQKLKNLNQHESIWTNKKMFDSYF